MKVCFGFLAVGFIAVLFYGCAMVQPEYGAFQNVVPNSADDLKYEFIDLTGRADSRDKIQKQEYTKIGGIEYRVYYNTENTEKLKTFAKEKNADALIIKNTGYKKDEIMSGYYGIYVIAVKYK